MSTLVAKNLQVGADGTASNNFTIYQPAAPDGTLRIGNGNTGTTSAQVVLTSAGNVGIGTSSPAARLNVVSDVTTAAIVQSSATASTLAINNTNANGWGSNLAIRTGGVDAGYFGTIGSLLGSTSQDLTVYTTAGNGFRVYTNGNNERMRIDSAGNVCVGTTSSPGRFGVSGVGGGTGDLMLDSNASYAEIQSFNNKPLYLNRQGNSVITALNGGNLLVGKTSNNQTDPGIVLGRQENGTAPLSDWVKTFSGSVDSIRNWHNGTYVGGVSFSNTATNFPTSSDARLKKDISEAPSATEKIDQVRVVSHGWKHDDAVVEFGVIAQELYAVSPQAVTPGDDGQEVERTWTVDYSKLVPMLIKAHQEQQAIIEQLKADVAALKGN
jgi:hypothetical protein